MPSLVWSQVFAPLQNARVDFLLGGVNNTDITTRTAWYSKGDAGAADASWSGQPLSFPRIQGADVCGHVVAVGDGVDQTRVGQRVLIEPCIREVNGFTLETPWFFGSECDGGFAEYTRVASRHGHRINSSLRDIELASFPCSYSRAENMLTRAAVQTTDTVLVTGPSGGVGSAAVLIGGPLVELDVPTLYLKDLSFSGCTILEPEVFGRLVRYIEDTRRARAPKGPRSPEGMRSPRGYRRPDLLL